VTHVYHWRNGMVMVFDQHGHQMPDYQGRYADVREKIVAVFPEERWICAYWPTFSSGLTPTR